VDERIRTLVAAHLPGYQVDAVRRLGEGQDNVAYEVNGELIVRVVKGSDASASHREARLLTAVGAVSPVPVPVPVFAADGILAYRRLPGIPLLSLEPATQHAFGPQVAARLGEFLAALHAAPLDPIAELAGTDDQPPSAWLADAAADYAAMAENVPADARASIEAYLSAAPPEAAGSLAFSHNDLGIEHVLVDPVTGDVLAVIDWSDAAITDPAYDLGLIYRDLGPAALDASLTAYGPTSSGLRERAVFYARSSTLEDMRYGLDNGLPAYADKSRRSLRWLFPS
jgi:aminoglycoside phosphotransferase (APT) family kinase protein